MSTLRSLIIDDEDHARATLRNLLQIYCATDITVVGEAATAEKIPAVVTGVRPDVVFLDIDIAGCNGFDLLRMVPEAHRDFLIVVVTGYEQYGIQALNEGALYYLLKPIDVDELVRAVARLCGAAALRRGRRNDTHSGSFVSIHGTGGDHVLQPDDILYCTPEGNYCRLYLRDHRQMLSHGSMKKIAAHLPREFVRIHHSCIVNVRSIREYISTGSGGYVVLADGTTLHVSRRHRRALLDILRSFSTGGTV